MDQPWNTRSGEETNHVGPKGGEDLAELQRAHQGPKRDRANIQQQKESEATKRRVHLEERAREQRIIEFFKSKAFLGSAAAVLITALAWFVVWPLANSALNPSADAGDLRSTQPQISLRALQVLRGEAKAKIIEGDSGWNLVYTLPRGSETFSGGRARKTCSVVFRVAKDQASKPQLNWTQLGAKHCA